MNKHVTLHGVHCPNGTYFEVGFAITAQTKYLLEGREAELSDALEDLLPTSLVVVGPGLMVRQFGDYAELRSQGETAMQARGVEVEAIVNRVLSRPKFLG